MLPAMPNITGYAAVALVAAALASAGTWQAQEWRYGAKEAQRLQLEREADELRQEDVRQARLLDDKAAAQHATDLAQLNTQLGDARAHIAALSRDRQCLGAGTVRVLNAIGKPPAGDVRAAAGQPDGPPPAAAGSAADGAQPTGYASERDTADYIALCRKGYAELSSQLNRIQDIEERRHAPAAGQ
jgi:type II secretory pathway component HofQ